MTTEVVEKGEVGKDFDIDGFLAKRQEFIQKVNGIMVEGKDYHVIQGRKSMAKGGAEKIASIFGWVAVFGKDEETFGMLGSPVGTLAYVCGLSKGGTLVGQGRGAATTKNNGNDPNKTIKMAQKSAFVDAVLRASGLSDFYTQDLGPEDEGSQYGHVQAPPPAGPRQESPAPTGNYPATKAQADLIRKLMDEKGISKLSDIGFEHREVITKAYASEIIDFLIKHQRGPAQEDPGEIVIERSDLPR